MLRHTKPLNSVLVKPAGPDCNMSCSYCFYLEKADLFSETKTHRMSDAVLEEMVRQVMTQGGSEVSFGWQGGEPTLMGLEFFEKVVAFQQKYGRNQSVGNGLQTNGILVDERWADFLQEYHFLVGLSLDGPEHVHDHTRRLMSGQGSWDKVINRAKLLLDADVEVNALTVVNDYSVQFPEEVYEFHKSLGLNYMQFIPCVETDPDDPARAAPFSVSPEAFGQFLVRLFDLWLADFKNGIPTTSIRYFESVFHLYVGVPPPMCTLFEECGNYVVVEHNGDVYACDFFVEPDWKLGNVMEGNLIDMLNSSRQKTFGKQKSRRPGMCGQCPWLNRCWGGCTKDRLRDPRDHHKNHFCQSYRIFFEHADGRLCELAERWTREHGWDNQISEQEERCDGKKVNRNDPCPCGSGKKYKQCCGK